MTKLYSIEKIDTPWGDYGDILLNGMTAHSSKQNNKLCLERTGPFIPPISFPGIYDIVITNSFRNKLVENNFNGFELVEVIKKKIVELNWELWDRLCDDPQRYPDNGEPENYILCEEHSHKICSQLGDLYEIAIPDTEGLQGKNGAINIEKYRGQDICRESRWGKVFISDNFKSWLETNYSEWVNFKIARIK